MLVNFDYLCYTQFLGYTIMNFRPEKFGHNKTRDDVDSKE